MKKILRLSFNEMYMIAKKRTILVLLMIIILMAPAASLLYQFVIASTETKDPERAGIDEQISYYSDLARDTEDELEQLADTTGNDYNTLAHDLLNDRTELYYYQLLQEKNLTDNNFYFMNKAAEALAELQAMAYVIDLCPQSTVALTHDTKTLVKQTAEYQTIYDTEDYSAFMKQYQRMIRENGSYSSTELDIELTVYRYWLAADLEGKNTGAELDHLLNKIRKYELALASGFDTTSAQVPTPLSDSAEEKLSNELKIVEYRLSNHQLSLSEREALGEKSFPFVWQIMLFLILGVAVYLAGTAIAGETNTGRLPVILTRPVKRSGILLSRILTYTVFCLVLIILSYYWTMLWTLLLYGKTGCVAHFYLLGNSVRMIGGIWFGLIKALLSFVWIWLAMLFALALSVCWRNVFAACILPIGAYFLCAFADRLITVELPYSFEKYLPSSNFDLTAAFFGTGGNTGEQPLFHLIYVLILAVCLLCTAFDSFVRRDF